MPPRIKFDIKLGGTLADLSGTYGMSAELLDDFGDLSGRSALDIPFGHSELEGLFAANTFFQRAWIKGDAVPDLKNAEFDGAHARGEGLRLEPIGAAKADLRGRSLSTAKTHAAS